MSEQNWLQKAKRLWQPKHPAFWVMLALNAASSVLVWLSQTYALSTPVRLIVLGFAVGNLWLGLKCARRLIDTPLGSEQASPTGQSDR